MVSEKSIYSIWPQLLGAIGGSGHLNFESIDTYTVSKMPVWDDPAIEVLRCVQVLLFTAVLVYTHIANELGNMSIGMQSLCTPSRRNLIRRYDEDVVVLNSCVEERLPVVECLGCLQMSRVASKLKDLCKDFVGPSKFSCDVQIPHPVEVRASQISSVARLILVTYSQR